MQRGLETGPIPPPNEGEAASSVSGLRRCPPRPPTNRAQKNPSTSFLLGQYPAAKETVSDQCSEFLSFRAALCPTVVAQYAHENRHSRPSACTCSFCTGALSNSR